ncbi:MAG: MarR family winged helix-turn-helix transcriptional regulator [Bacilli bacterium]|jgi:DNA-binding MarR family transcriptional regulator|nr:MarR family winged helix-turn-helix transcriptional regulator [Bacilli bacterium]
MKENDIIRLILNIDTEVIKIINDKIKDSDLKYFEFRAVYNISLIDEVSQNKLCEILGINKTMATRIIQVLEEKEYIERINNENDHRYNIVRITDKGKEKAALFNEIMLDISNKLLNGITDIEQDEMYYQLLKTYGNSVALKRKIN